MVRKPDPRNARFWVGATFTEILAQQRIDIGRHSLRPGGAFKLVCPECGGGKSRGQSLSVWMSSDGEVVHWKCHRVDCPDFNGFGCIDDGRSERSAPRQATEPKHWEERPNPVKPRPTPAGDQLRPIELYDFFAKRGISRETVDAFGIYGTMHKFDVPKPTTVFPYRWRGELVNRKYRSRDKDFRQDKDTLRTLFNIDAWESDDVGILVEGEMDVLALWEAGYRQVASLPDGAPQRLYEESDPKRFEDKRFDAMQTCADVLAKMKIFIIATDADVPGGYLAEEFARRLGRIRCKRVTWPPGAKDANDVLMQHGADKLRECIEAAQPWPLAGIVEIRPGQLNTFLRSGKQPSGLPCGIGSMDDAFRLPAGSGWLTVVTGMPSAGKTSFVRPWLAYLIEKHDLGVVWCSPEDNKAEVSALELARIRAGQPLQEAGTYIPEAKLAEAEEWIGRRISFLQSDNPDEEMALKWVIDRASEAKRRSKRNLLVLDPWNEHEFAFEKNETETQYTGRWLRRLKAWGRAEGMSVLIVAHPKVQQKDQKTRKYAVADGYDINGGANWFNKADLGITVARGDDGNLEAHCWKARFRAFGTKGAMARLRLDPRTGGLRSLGLKLDDQSEMLGDKAR